MEIFDFEQGTPEWHQARLGIITASEMKSVLSKGRGSEPSKTRRDYMYKLIGERITQEPAESYQGWQTERGHVLEPEAFEIYSSVIDEPVTKTGFIKNFGIGYSPDALVGADGLAEIKSRIPKVQVELLLENTVPPEVNHQIQTGLFVAERKWLDYVSYCPKMPLFVMRVYRDEKIIDTIQAESQRFYDELANAIEEIKIKTR